MYLFRSKSKKCYLWWDTPTCRSNLIYISVAKCRGTKSSNRIELFWLVQDLLNFTDLGIPLGVEWGGWIWVGWCGCVGCPMHACLCMHAHTCTCMCFKHDHFLQRLPPWENPWEMNEFTCLHACDTPTPPPTPISNHPTQPNGGPSKSVKM